MRVFDDARVGGQNTGNVCPVFIQACADGTGNNRTSYVRPAAREGMHGSVRHCPVEAGDHGTLNAYERMADGGVRRVRVERAVGMEQNHLRRIDKAEAEIGGQQFGIEIFAPAGHIIALGALAQMRLDGGKVRLEIDGQMQRVNNVGKALSDLGEHRRRILSCAGGVIAAVKKIRDLRVAVKALARRGSDNIAAGWVFPDDCRNLFKLCGGCQRTAAEFHNDRIHGELLSMGVLALFSHKVPRRVNHVFAETCFFGKKSAHRRKTSVFLSGTHKAAGQTSGGLQQCRLNRAACKRFKHSL